MYRHQLVLAIGTGMLVSLFAACGMDVDPAAPDVGSAAPSAVLQSTPQPEVHFPHCPPGKSLQCDDVDCEPWEMPNHHCPPPVCTCVPDDPSAKPTQETPEPAAVTDFVRVPKCQPDEVVECDGNDCEPWEMPNHHCPPPTCTCVPAPQ